MAFVANNSLGPTIIKTTGLILACNIIFVISTAYSEEYNSVPIVLFTETNSKALPYTNLDILNITSRTPIEIKNIDVHTTSGGEVCAVVYDKNNNQYSAYFITKPGNPKLLSGSDMDLCFGNSDALRVIISNVPLNTWLWIAAPITAILLTVNFLHRDIRQFKRSVTTLLERGSYIAAGTSLLIVLIVTIFEPANRQEYSAESSELFLSAVTIMGFAVFGSAFSSRSRNKNLTKSIAYTLIPLIVVQAAFMMGLIGHGGFTVELWILMTTIFLMATVLALAANNIHYNDKNNGTQDGAFKGGHYHSSLPTSLSTNVGTEGEYPSESPASNSKWKFEATNTGWNLEVTSTDSKNPSDP